MSKELRFAVQELRAAGSEKEKILVGYACTWNTQTDIGDFTEVLAPKPFKGGLDSAVFLVNHDDNQILGRAGVNLKLTQDDIGLRFECSLNESQMAQDAWENTRSGLLRECSFAFTANPGGETWTALPNGKVLRTLTDLTLWDASVVTYPAYSGTSAKARNVVAADIQERMSSATSTAAETEKRRQRVEAVIAQIAEEDRKRAEQREAQAIEDAKLLGKFAALKS